MITMVGLIGEPSSGKDTIADYAIEDLGFRRIGFADKIYSCALAIDPIVATTVFETGEITYKRLSDVVTEIGWRQAKDAIPEVRRLLQRIGTEMGREEIDPNFWISLAFKRMHAYYEGSGHELDRFIFTDVRYTNEQDKMIETAQALGGKAKFVRVRRPGFGAVNNHASENEYDNLRYDARITNDSSLHDLRLFTNDVVSRMVK